MGSLNGYAIACGASPDYLREMWLDEDFASFSRLEANVRRLTEGHRPRVECAVVITDLLRMKPRVIRGDDIKAEHLLASCAVPLVLPQVRIDGRYYGDGGLLNPLPVYAAVDLGATEIVGLHALPEIPSAILKPLSRGFQAVLGVHPPLPLGVRLTTIKPDSNLGSLRDAVRFKRENIERWLEQGFRDAQKTFPL